MAQPEVPIIWDDEDYLSSIKEKKQSKYTIAGIARKLDISIELVIIADELYQGHDIDTALKAVNERMPDETIIKGHVEKGLKLWDEMATDDTKTGDDDEPATSDEIEETSPSEPKDEPTDTNDVPTPSTGDDTDAGDGDVTEPPAADEADEEPEAEIDLDSIPEKVVVEGNERWTCEGMARWFRINGHADFTWQDIADAHNTCSDKFGQADELASGPDSAVSRKLVRNTLKTINQYLVELGERDPNWQDEQQRAALEFVQQAQAAADEDESSSGDNSTSADPDEHVSLGLGTVMDAPGRLKEIMSKPGSVKNSVFKRWIASEVRELDDQMASEMLELLFRTEADYPQKSRVHFVFYGLLMHTSSYKEVVSQLDDARRLHSQLVNMADQLRRGTITPVEVEFVVPKAVEPQAITEPPVDNTGDEVTEVTPPPTATDDVTEPEPPEGTDTATEPDETTSDEGVVSDDDIMANQPPASDTPVEVPVLVTEATVDDLFEGDHPPVITDPPVDNTDGDEVTLVTPPPTATDDVTEPEPPQGTDTTTEPDMPPVTNDVPSPLEGNDTQTGDDFTEPPATSANEEPVVVQVPDRSELLQAFQELTQLNRTATDEAFVRAETAWQLAETARQRNSAA